MSNIFNIGTLNQLYEESSDEKLKTHIMKYITEDGKLSLLKTKQRHIHKQLDEINKEIINHKEAKSKLEPKILCELHMREPELDSLKDNFTYNEIESIVRGMDKTDYNRGFGEKKSKSYPKYLDLDMIVESINKVKNIHKNWHIHGVYKVYSEDSYPPRNYYEYEYVDENKTHYTVGRWKTS